MPRSRKTPEQQLHDLEEKEAQLKARKQDLKARVRQEQRKQDTRRKVIVGAVVMEHANHDPQFADLLEHVLSKAVVRDADRELLGLDRAPADEPKSEFDAASAAAS